MCVTKKHRPAAYGSSTAVPTTIKVEHGQESGNKRRILALFLLAHPSRPRRVLDLVILGFGCFLFFGLPLTVPPRWRLLVRPLADSFDYSLRQKNNRQIARKAFENQIGKNKD